MTMDWFVNSLLSRHSKILFIKFFYAELIIHSHHIYTGDGANAHMLPVLATFRK